MIFVLFYKTHDYRDDVILYHNDESFICNLISKVSECKNSTENFIEILETDYINKEKIEEKISEINKVKKFVNSYCFLINNKIDIEINKENVKKYNIQLTELRKELNDLRSEQDAYIKNVLTERKNNKIETHFTKLVKYLASNYDPGYLYYERVKDIDSYIERI